MLKRVSAVLSVVVLLFLGVRLSLALVCDPPTSSEQLAARLHLAQARTSKFLNPSQESVFGLKIAVRDRNGKIIRYEALLATGGGKRGPVLRVEPDESGVGFVVKVHPMDMMGGQVRVIPTNDVLGIRSEVSGTNIDVARANVEAALGVKPTPPAVATRETPAAAALEEPARTEFKPGDIVAGADRAAHRPLMGRVVSVEGDKITFVKVDLKGKDVVGVDGKKVEYTYTRREFEEIGFYRRGKSEAEVARAVAPVPKPLRPELAELDPTQRLADQLRIQKALPGGVSAEGIPRQLTLRDEVRVRRTPEGRSVLEVDMVDGGFYSYNAKTKRFEAAIRPTDVGTPTGKIKPEIITPEVKKPSLFSRLKNAIFGGPKSSATATLPRGGDIIPKDAAEAAALGIPRDKFLAIGTEGLAAEQRNLSEELGSLKSQLDRVRQLKPGEVVTVKGEKYWYVGVRPDGAVNLIDRIPGVTYKQATDRNYAMTYNRLRGGLDALAAEMRTNITTAEARLREVDAEQEVAAQLARSPLEVTEPPRQASAAAQERVNRGQFRIGDQFSDTTGKRGNLVVVGVDEARNRMRVVLQDTGETVTYQLVGFGRQGGRFRLVAEGEAAGGRAARPAAVAEAPRSQAEPARPARGPRMGEPLESEAEGRLLGERGLTVSDRVRMPDGREMVLDGRLYRGADGRVYARVMTPENAARLDADVENSMRHGWAMNDRYPREYVPLDQISGPGRRAAAVPEGGRPAEASRRAAEAPSAPAARRAPEIAEILDEGQTRTRLTGKGVEIGDNVRLRDGREVGLAGVALGRDGQYYARFLPPEEVARFEASPPEAAMIFRFELVPLDDVVARAVSRPEFDTQVRRRIDEEVGRFRQAGEVEREAARAKAAAAERERAAAVEVAARERAVADARARVEPEVRRLGGEIETARAEYESARNRLRSAESDEETVRAGGNPKAVEDARRRTASARQDLAIAGGRRRSAEHRVAFFKSDPDLAGRLFLEGAVFVEGGRRFRAVSVSGEGLIRIRGDEQSLKTKPTAPLKVGDVIRQERGGNLRVVAVEGDNVRVVEERLVTFDNFKNKFTAEAPRVAEAPAAPRSATPEAVVPPRLPAGIEGTGADYRVAAARQADGPGALRDLASEIKRPAPAAETAARKGVMEGEDRPEQRVIAFAVRRGLQGADSPLVADHRGRVRGRLDQAFDAVSKGSTLPEAHTSAFRKAADEMRGVVKARLGMGEGDGGLSTDDVRTILRQHALLGADGKTINVAAVSRFVGDVLGYRGVDDATARGIIEEVRNGRISQENLAVIVAYTRGYQTETVNYMAMAMKLGMRLNADELKGYGALQQKGFGVRSGEAELREALVRGAISASDKALIDKAKGDLRDQGILFDLIKNGVIEARVKATGEVETFIDASRLRAELDALVRQGILSSAERQFFESNISRDLNTVASRATEIRAEFDKAYSQVRALAGTDPELARMIDDAIVNGKIAIICGCP